MTLFKFHIAFVLFFFGWSTPKTGLTCETRYEIKILHPGIDLTEPVDKTLVRTNCALGESTSFYMDVESVVCGDSQCRIDIVRIYWDELGFYKRLELPRDVELEKAEGASFSDADYQKLDSILADGNSSLKYAQKYEVTGSETSEGVDALSGATIALDTKSYVKGAVWTCYTMWHWVNGEVRTKIRNISGANMSTTKLMNYLAEESIAKKIFSLEQLILNNKQEVPMNETFLEQANNENHEVQKLLIKYVERLPAEEYFSAIDKFLLNQNQALRLLSLRSLLESKMEAPNSYFAKLSMEIGNWEFQEVSIFLDILKQKKATSQKATEQILSLLYSKKFIIARRAYWFLSKQELAIPEKNKLQAFYKKNSKKL